MYCEFQPSYGDWIILLFMGCLQDVNKMYKEKEAVAELEKRVSDDLKAKRSRSVYYLNRAWRIVQMLLGVVTQVILIFLIAQI
jgi:hypothetical protein